MIFMPPQEGKSELVSRRFPARALGLNPDRRVVVASYSAELANSFNLDTQKIILDSKFGEIFPGIQLNLNLGRREIARRKDDLFEIIGRAGSYRSVGVGGSLTGNPADIFIIDDPIKDHAEAYSKSRREYIWNWYTDVVLTRLHNQSQLCVTVTRWHEDDLPGRILKFEGADKWFILRLPAIKEDDEDPEDPRKIGEPLWPEKHSLEFLQAVQARSNRTFVSLYQQRPRKEEGTIIMRGWFKYFQLTDLPHDRDGKPQFFKNFRSDTAYGKEKSDNSATICYTIHSGNLYIFNVWPANLPFPRFISAYKDFLVNNGYSVSSRAFFEPKASGISTVQQLRVETLPNGDKINIIEGKSPSDSKETRVSAASAKVQAGMVFLLADQPWIESFIDECTAFPFGDKDDCVDAMAAIINEELDKQSLADQLEAKSI